MKKSKFTEPQIFEMLKQFEAGVAVTELCRKYSAYTAAFYKQKAKYSGMDTSMMKRLRELEEENSRLKRMYANAVMDNKILKATLKKL